MTAPASPFKGVPKSIASTKFLTISGTGTTDPFQEELYMVNAICELSNGLVVVGGAFNMVNSGVTRHHLAMWNNFGGTTKTGKLNPFSPTLRGVPPLRSTKIGTLAPYEAVCAIVPSLDELHLYIGGSYTSVAGIARTNLSRVDLNGAVDPWVVNVSGGVNPVVRTIALDYSNTTTKPLFIGGKFSQAGTVSGLANFARTTANPSPTVDGTGAWAHTFDNEVYKILVDAPRHVYVFGRFTSVGQVGQTGGQPRLFAAQFDMSGNLQAWTPGPIPTNWDPAHGAQIGVLDAGLSPDRLTLVLAMGGSGAGSTSTPRTTATLLGFHRATTGSSFPTIPTWASNAPVLTGSASGPHMAVAVNDTLAWAGFNGDASQGSTGKHDSRLYAVRLTDGRDTWALSTSDTGYWEQETSPPYNGTSGTVALEVGPNGLYVGGAQTTPRPGVVKYDKSGTTPPPPPSGITVYAVGDGATGSSTARTIASRIPTPGAANFDRFLYLGDVYNDGTVGNLGDRTSEYVTHYDTVYGSQGLNDLRSKTSAIPGNHDYHDAGAIALGYRNYWQGKYTVTQPFPTSPTPASDSGPLYYNFILGAYKFIGVDTNQDLAVGSPQYSYIANQLTTDLTKKKILYSHHGRWSADNTHPDSDFSSATHTNDLWKLACDSGNAQGNGCVLWLCGHSHNMQHHVLRDRTGNKIAGRTGDGTVLLEILAGGGGAGNYTVVSTYKTPNGFPGLVWGLTGWGFLKMVLTDTNMHFEFRGTDGAILHQWDEPVLATS